MRPALFVALLVLLVTATMAAPVGVGGSSARTDPRDVLDLGLRTAATRGVVPLNAARVSDRPAATDQPAAGREPRVSLFLTGSPDESRLRELGVRVHTRAGSVLTAEAPLSALVHLGEIAGLSRALIARPASLQLDLSLPAVFADSVRERSGDNWSGLTGEGVVIGVMDSGLDVDHPDFLHPDGTTRVLFYWDQADDLGPAPVRAPGDTLYGSEYTAGDINAGLVRDVDRLGHGTHVAGIAAGNGRGSDVDSLRYRYAGLAPRADLIIVSAEEFLETDILDAVDYVFRKAEERGQPAVMNLSLGVQAGPHDGTGPLDLGLDALAGPGRLITAAGGNEARDRVHAELHLSPGGSDSATVEVPAYDADPEFNFFTVDAFYSRPDSFAVTLVSPTGLRFGPFLLGEETDTPSPDGTVALLHWDPDAVGDNLEVQIDVSDFDPHHPEVPGALPAPGGWRVVFDDLNGAAGGGEVDLWLPGAVPFLPMWTVDRYDPSEEIPTPGSAHRVIAVAAFNTKQCWPEVTGDERCSGIPSGLTEADVAPGPISYFSSHGPTRDGREKPDVAAPGFLVSSSYSGDIDPAILVSLQIHRLLHPDRQHWVNAGTSMSTPHVTGAAALWLQEHPAAEPESVMTRLRLSAVHDAFTGEGWSPRAGHGKLNVAGFVDPSLVPVRTRSLTVSTRDGRPHLRWAAADSDPVARFRLESRGASNAWRERADFRGPGPHQWTDPTSDGPVTYRLLAHRRDGTVELWAEATWSAEPTVPVLRLSPAQPNPTREGTRVAFQLRGATGAGWVEARVYDVAGRLVRELDETWMDGEGSGVVEWDGIDATGKISEAGVYWIQVRRGSRSGTVRLVRLP